MSNDKIIKAAFLVSLGLHSLLFVFPKINLTLPEIEPSPKIEITINKLPLLPKIDQLGEEKKLRTIKNEPAAPEPELKKQKKIPAEVKEHIPKIKPKLHNEPIKIEGPDTRAILRYQDMIKRKIQEERRYPHWAKQQRYQGSAYLKFTVLKNGSIQNMQILRSSGHRILDEEALNTLKRAQPFPKIPKKIPLSEMQMEIHIVFQLS